jgi:hypothetical protein
LLAIITHSVHILIIIICKVGITPVYDLARGYKFPSV